jgi:signal transduction histidine kinase/DNA-binding NarL/FixJ family response regulator
MAETYQILLIEKDKQVADDIRRYLRASVGKADFAVTLGEDIQQSKTVLSTSKPDIVLIDATMIDKGAAFNGLKQQLSDNNIPVLVLSTTNGQELKDKAEAAGASDYLLKNKLNYFYLPKTILAVIKSRSSNSSDNVSSSVAHQTPKLLDQVSDAIMVIDKKGTVLYANSPARRMLSDIEVITVLRRFIDADAGEQKTMKASVELQGADYELKIAPQQWGEEHALSLHLHQETSGAAITLQEKITLLSDLIHSCSLPFVIMVNDHIITTNQSFLSLVKAEKGKIEGMRLEDYITTDRRESINLLKPQKPNLVRAIRGASLTAPLELLQKSIAAGDDTITVCSLAAPGAEEQRLLSPHRLMEIASHDLREPVRTTVSYLHLLTEGLKKEGGSKKLLEYAETITAEMSRAERMLADMKSLMNLRDKTIKPVRVNMMAVVQDALKQLKTNIDAKDAMVNVSEMPEVKADSEDMKRLLFHLLDNALKFHKKDKRPYVEILSRKEGKEWQFCIKDNGIGIDKKYQEVIFEPFRKLNRVDEYEGAGNGLCISKHIIETHNGKIWVESHEGFGSSFFFTLPAS